MQGFTWLQQAVHYRENSGAHSPISFTQNGAVGLGGFLHLRIW